MKLYLLLASLIAVSVAAPSIDTRAVEERLLRDAAGEAVDVERSPATADELLELRELQLRINAMMAEQEIASHKVMAGLHALDGADSLYNREQQLVQPKRFIEDPTLTPEQRLLLEKRTHPMTPLQQLMFLKEEKLLALNKDRDMLNYRRSQLNPLQEAELFKKEKLLDLEKEEEILGYKRSHLTPLQELALLKEEKLAELEKERDLLEHKENQLGPLELFKEEKLLELEKERDLLDHKESQLGPLELFKEEKLLDLEKDERILGYRRSHLTPMEELALLKEERLLELEKERDLLEHRESELGPAQLFKDEKLVELNKEEKLLDYRRNNLTPMQQLILLKKEKLARLEKERDLLSHKESQLSPLEQLKMENLLELNKEEKLLGYKRSQLTPLQELALLKQEKMLDLQKDEDLLKHKRSDLTPLQELTLLKEEKLLALQKEEDLLKHQQQMNPMSPKEELLEKLFPGLHVPTGLGTHKLDLLERFPALVTLTVSLNQMEQTITDEINTEMRQLAVDDLLVMHRHFETANESLRRIRFMMLLQLLGIEMGSMTEQQMLPSEALMLMMKRNRAEEELEWQRMVDQLLLRYRTGQASLAMTIADYKRAETTMNARPVLSILENIADRVARNEIMEMLNSTSSDDENLTFLRDLEFLRLIQNEHLGELWSLYKLQYNRTYLKEVEAIRKEIFADKVKLIIYHNIQANLGKYKFLMAVNEYTDWTVEELAKLRGQISPSTPRGTKSEQGHRVKRQAPAMPMYRNTVNVSTLPATVNWTAQGWVGPVLNQGECGACWAFAASEALSAQYYNKTKTFVALSEQNLIDCTTSYGNTGCDGGAFQYAFNYVMDVGIDTASSYPYTATNGTCQYSSSNSVTNDNGWWNIETNSELALQQAVALVGPVAVGIDAGLPTFQYYRSGVYAASACTAANIDHAVVVVGYGTTSTGEDYWLIKNSWGTSWGIDGYMMMARNDGNMCGIANDAGMPVIN